MTDHRSAPSVTRRRLLAGLGATAVTAGTAGCAGWTGRAGSTAAGSERGVLKFMTWGGDQEALAFRRLVRRFETSTGARVDLQLVPYGEMFTNIDASLQAGTAPDVFRVDYPTMSVYSSRDVLLDVGETLDASTRDDLLPALLRAVSYEDRVFGAPHQTDTTAVVYRPDLLEAAGIDGVPQRLDAAWTWDQFAGVSDRLRVALEESGRGTRPFAYDWQELGAFRWLTWLISAGGRLLEDDLRTPALVSDAGRRALGFTRGFFERGWVPANTSVKSATYPDAAFVSGGIAMAFVGNFLLPFLDTEIGRDFPWEVTFQPREVRATSDLGGNALVATRTTRNPGLAKEFLAFMLQPDSMRAFCAATSELPTRRSLVKSGIDFAVRPDLMSTYVDQSTTIADEDVAQVTVPFFGQVNVLLQDELELAFRGEQPVEETLERIAEGIVSAGVGT